MDLAEFLRARLDDDQVTAEAASPGPWRPDLDQYEVLAADDITVAEGFALSDNQLRATVIHVARHDPARVLVEVDAKRRIIERFMKLAADQEANDARSLRLLSNEEIPSWQKTTWTLQGATGELGYALRLLALPYADHPEYHAEWRP